MGVLETSGELDLLEKAIRPQVRREVGMQDLDRHSAAMLDVLGQVNRGHRPFAQHTVNPVAAGEHAQ